jgi:trehalose 6-phosphate synthase
MEIWNSDDHPDGAAGVRPLLRSCNTGRLIVLANRQPIAHERTSDGRIVIERSTSGLVTASEAVVRAYGGVWVAHGAGSADRDVVDEGDGVPVPDGAPEYRLRRVWLDAAEQRGYYYGFANEGLWPLCHRVHVRPEFRSSDFDMYWTINERFVDAVDQEAGDAPALVLVQDYHFAMAPLMLRERNVNHAIVAFWHIPWPTVDRLGICPWATYLLEGLLASNLIGFQTPADAVQFLDAAEHLLGASVDRKRGVATYRDRRTHVRAYPASVTWPCDALDQVEPADQCRALVRQALGLGMSERLIVGIDRLDYTKGLEEKILAVERLLEQSPEYRGALGLVQIAQPSRQQLPAYRELRQRVLALAERVNARFSTESWSPIHLIERHVSQAEVYRLLRAADVCYVGSLHDGMNLVAKEFVAARADDDGVLVLSAFAGAAHELEDAVLVNPYDIEQTANALDEALTMDQAVRRARMRRMRVCVSSWTSAEWSAQLLGDAARLCSAPAMDLCRVRAPVN